MTGVRLSLAEAEALVAGALVRSRTSPANAASVAAALVRAEASGQSGHGLRRVTSYAAQARSGKVDGFAEPSLAHTAPGVLAVDVANGFAFPAIERAVRQLPAIARRQGVALAGFRRSHHAGVLGLLVEDLAEAGLVALAFANTPAAMAPWGGRTALFGTNPIAFAAPCEGRAPVVVDLSLSKVARGRIMAAKQQGIPIPEGWALDPEGRATTDAAAGLAGTMVPLGDAKGTALALMVEMLAAGLVGANYAAEASSFFDAEGEPPGVGQLVIAIDPGLVGGAGVTARFAELAAAVEADAGRVPGARGRSLRMQAASEGIVVDEAVVAEIRSIGG
ncbi:Ldh family oxidoreductase [Propylenella binzhouense]|uniref:Ldh family oxidoreductase n=1 Tax=Propylenella binzhouense TaxID=2555902 RepID=A0A964T4N5_9HYPH|nr:Ldh family oxidoreductase [Propylenella binzhouense]MYZ48279.1 Ldh family oxidoreductase [Propylenella binzhouense]